MTTEQLAKINEFELIAGKDGVSASGIKSIYCCDLLSLVMARAPAESAWLTVMGNLNSIAVAALGDIACIVLCEGMPMDADAIKKANDEGIAVFATKLPVFEAAVLLNSFMD